MISRSVRIISPIPTPRKLLRLGFLCVLHSLSFLPTRQYHLYWRTGFPLSHIPPYIMIRYRSLSVTGSDYGFSFKRTQI